MIAYNDQDSIGRQNSSIVHEVSHGLLQHQPGPPSTTVAAVCGIKATRTKRTGCPARSSSLRTLRSPLPEDGCPRQKRSFTSVSASRCQTTSSTSPGHASAYNAHEPWPAKGEASLPALD